MPEIEVEVEVFCGTCGAGLCNQSVGGNTPRRGTPCINVEACEKCMDTAKNEGYDEGYEEARREFEKE